LVDVGLVADLTRSVDFLGQAGFALWQGERAVPAIADGTQVQRVECYQRSRFAEPLSIWRESFAALISVTKNAPRRKPRRANPLQEEDWFS